MLRSSEEAASVAPGSSTHRLDPVTAESRSLSKNAHHLITDDCIVDHVMTSTAALSGDARHSIDPGVRIVQHRDIRTRLRIGSIAAVVLVSALIGTPATPTVSPGRASTAAAPTAHGPDVPPGGVVRWPGVGIENCEMSGRSWPAYHDACWIPIDLLQEPGVIEVERTRGGVVETTTFRIGEYPYPTQHLTVAPEMANPPDSQLERIRRESDRVGALWSLGGPPRFELPLQAPLDPLPEARSFGSRRLFNGESRDPHSGVDFSAPEGAAVHVAAAGRVMIAADHYFAGRSVFVDHGDDLITMYFHLEHIDVREGDTVERGQVIGSVGSTGRVTGPHLHFGVRWHGARIDPTVLLGDTGRVVGIETTNRD